MSPWRCLGPMRQNFVTASVLSALTLSVLVGSGAGRASPTRPNPCPHGDNAGQGLADLKVESVDVDVDIADGVANVRYSMLLENHSSGPGFASLTLSSATGHDDIDVGDAPPLVIRRAALKGAPALVLRDADGAKVEFDAFTDALSVGVAAADVRLSKNRSAMLVEEADRHEIGIKVAAACSVRRARVVVEGATLAIARPGGQRFAIPALTAHDRVRVREHNGSTMWANGRRVSSGARMTDIVAVADNAVAPVVVDLHATTVLKARGVLQTRKAPSPRDKPAPADGAGADADGGADDDDDGAADEANAGLSVLHAALDLPQVLVPAPAAPRLVFVVDASVSAGDDGLQKSLHLMGKVLDAAPDDTRWSLVTFARRAQLVVDPWRARDDRFLPAIVVDNGSDVAAALALADRVAADAEEGSARVIVISDLQQTSALAARLPVALRRGPRHGTAAPLHLLRTPADLGADEHLSWERMMPMPVEAGDDEGDALTQAVTARGGLFVILRGNGDSIDDEGSLARSLIRPTRLDQPRLYIDGAEVSVAANDAEIVVVDASGSSGSASSLPDYLVEGGGLRLSTTVHHQLENGPRRAELRGFVWGEAVRLPVSLPDANGARATVVGTVINDTLRDTLEDHDVAAFATSTGIVSRMTSLAMVSSFRPAEPEGYGRSAGFACGCGCGCCGGSRSSCGCGIVVPAVILKAQEILNTRAQEIADECRASVNVAVEIGDLELLDVANAAPSSGAAALSPSAKTCVVEAWWRTRFDRLDPGDGSFQAQRRYTVEAAFDADGGEADHEDAVDVSDDAIGDIDG